MLNLIAAGATYLFPGGRALKLDLINPERQFCKTVKPLFQNIENILDLRFLHLIDIKRIFSIIFDQSPYY